MDRNLNNPKKTKKRKKTKNNSSKTENGPPLKITKFPEKSMETTSNKSAYDSTFDYFPTTLNEKQSSLKDLPSPPKIKSNKSQIKTNSSKDQVYKYNNKPKMSEAEVNASKAEANTSKAEANTYKAEANISKAEANTSKTESNTSKTKANTSKAEANTSKAEAQTSKTKLKLTQTNSNATQIDSLERKASVYKHKLNEKQSNLFQSRVNKTEPGTFKCEPSSISILCPSKSAPSSFSCDISPFHSELNTNKNSCKNEIITSKKLKKSKESKEEQKVGCTDKLKIGNSKNQKIRNSENQKIRNSENQKIGNIEIEKLKNIKKQKIKNIEIIVRNVKNQKARDTEKQTGNIEKHIRNTENQMRNTENLTRNFENQTSNIENQTRNIENQTRNTEELIKKSKKQNVNVSGQSKHFNIPEHSRIRRLNSYRFPAYSSDSESQESDEEFFKTIITSKRYRRNLKNIEEAESRKKQVRFNKSVATKDNLIHSTNYQSKDDNSVIMTQVESNNSNIDFNADDSSDVYSISDDVIDDNLVQIDSMQNSAESTNRDHNKFINILPKNSMGLSQNQVSGNGPILNDLNNTNNANSVNSKADINSKADSNNITDLYSISDSNSIADLNSIEDLTNLVDLNSPNSTENEAEDDNLPQEVNSSEDESQATCNSIIVEKCNTRRFYDLPEGQLLLISKNQKVYLFGCTSITVLEGNVEVYGFQLKQMEEYKAFSPKGYSHIYINNVTVEKPCINFSRLLAAGLPKADLSKVLATDAVVLCRKLNNKQMDFVEKHIAETIFPINSFRFSFETVAGNLNILNDSVVSPLLVNDIQPGKKYMICGGKGVGKSTSLRVLTNKLLSVHKNVLIIDLDPGQCEFTIPGCISATIISEPLLGPNYTHLQNPKYCICLGTIDVGDIPTLYLREVENLLKLCRDLPEMPILINCMGFTRGIGLNIMASLVAIIKPHKLLEITCLQDPIKNYQEELRPDVLDEYRKLSTPEILLSEFEHITIPSVTSSIRPWHAKKLREISVLSYFSQCIFDDGLDLPSAARYECPLSMLKLDKKKLCKINGQLVALCCKENLCHGWALVQGIDLVNNLIAVITPVDLEKRPEIDRLKVSGVNVPPSIYMSQDNCIGMVPYVQVGSLSGLGELTKVSFHMPTKKAEVVK